MRIWLSEGKAQYVAGGAMWALAAVAMLAFGYGGCFAHGAEPGNSPGAVTTEDFASLLPPGVTPFVLPAAAPAASGATAEADAGGSAGAHWGWWVAASDMAVTVLLWLLTTAAGWAAAWLRKWGIQKEHAQRAAGFVEAGVRETYLEYVRAIKKAKDGDGKLTTDERKEATRRAIEYAKLYAVNEGADLLKLTAKSVLPLLVDKAVAKLKGAKAPLA